MPVYTQSTFPIGIPAINTYLKVGNGASPEVYNIVANVGDITGPGLSSTVQDVTSHSTGNPWRQKLVTLLDNGDITLPVFFVPASEGPVTGANPFPHGAAYGLLSLFTQRGQGGVAGAPFSFALEYPDGYGTTDYFQGFISKFSQKAAVAGVLMADITITLTGEPVLGG